MPAKKGNKHAVGNEGGRPALFNTPEQLQAKVDAYFEYIKGEKNPEPINDDDKWGRMPEPATITGLTLYLGFCHRQSLTDQEDRGQEFSDIIKRAKLRVEAAYERSLHFQSPTGAIFALKNMGWRDKTETEHSGALRVEQITGMNVK